MLTRRHFTVLLTVGVLLVVAVACDRAGSGEPAYNGGEYEASEAVLPQAATAGDSAAGDEADAPVAAEGKAVGASPDDGVGVPAVGQGGFQRGASAVAGVVTIIINFDRDAAGNNIPHNARIDNEYAAIGVHFDGDFFAARRTIAYPDYQTTTTLNLLCTAVGKTGPPGRDCLAPPLGSRTKLDVNLDFPVIFASIEGRTRTDAFDSDGPRIQAFDAVGNLLGEGQDI